MRATPWMIVTSMTMLFGCTAPAASTECVAAWEASVDEGEACEVSVAPLLGEAADPDEGGLDRGEGGTPPLRVTGSPRDAASGLATGRRQHQPMTLTMD